METENKMNEICDNCDREYDGSYPCPCGCGKFKSEFCLSDKIETLYSKEMKMITHAYNQKDVREFINQREAMLVEFIEDHIVTRPTGKLIRILPYEWDNFLIGFRKLAGEKLINTGNPGVIVPQEENSKATLTSIIPEGFDNLDAHIDAGCIAGEKCKLKGGSSKDVCDECGEEKKLHPYMGVTCEKFKSKEVGDDVSKAEDVIARAIADDIIKEKKLR